jgi:hypothetical protein
MLCKRHEGEIDWPDLARRFSNGRHTPVLVRTVSLARELFHFPKATPAIGAEDGALQKLRRSVERPKRQIWVILISVSRRFLQLLRAPYRHLSLLNFWTWPQRLARVGRILRTPHKW